MEIRQLRYFELAAQEKSFARAAEAAFTSRQNVARAIKDLESELKVSLFERKGNSLSLTPAGEIALQRTLLVLEAIEDLKAAGDGKAAEQPHVRMVISPNLFSGLSANIGSVIEKYVITDRVSELSAKECYERILEGEADIAIVNAMEREFPGCHVQKVGDSAGYLLVGENSRLAKKAHYTVADLRNVSFILMPDARFQYEPLFELLDDFGISDRVGSVTSTSSMLHIIKQLDVAAIVTDKFSAAPPRGTAVIPIIDPRLGWHTYVLHSNAKDAQGTIENLTRSLRAVRSRQLKASFTHE